ncbi:hypothetical protein HLK59_23470 [Streptomyces sp. S3(2020)]|uniref:hypothetical protein n=1 Tax=Streptomyces sp. S3(2020) TaxID=2732044 RepID=UPI001488BCD1|nr:hypothetical protein [Streptomyces sp. S3(2020)]NNN33264.1 hypothetical protein [Streptomyces sp. S3(2020)]
MGYVVLALLLIVGAAAAVAVQRRQGGRAEPVVPVAVPLSPAIPEPGPRPESESESGARVEAERWVERLGAGPAGIDAAGDKAAVQALADATERYRAAKEELAAGRYDTAARTAVEGLHYVRAARTALRLDPGPVLPGLGTPAVTARDGRVILDERTYTVSNRWRDGVTPYYYAGGIVAGRRVPGGWYSSPWWNPALAVA